MATLPKPYSRFKKKYEEVWSAYDQLGAAVHKAGPLDEKSRELVKLGIAVGARFEGSVHTHARRAIEAGASPEEIRQVVLLAIPTMGFPPMMAAMTWVDDVLKSK